MTPGVRLYLFDGGFIELPRRNVVSASPAATRW